MKPLDISACFIVKDEEKFIGRALASIRPYVAEIVVLDTGSSDATMDIAGSGADVLRSMEWRGDFSAARNACAKFASHDWIFAMDADEEVALFDLEGVARALDENPKALGRYSIRNVGDTAQGDAVVPVTRVYDRRFFLYEGTVHETLVPMNSNDRPLFGIPVLLAHYGYTREVAAEKKKTARNRELLLMELERNPEDAYYHYQLGKNYSFADEKERACEAFAKALSMGGSARLEYVADLVECYGNALLSLKRYVEAAELLRYANDFPSPRNQFAFGMINMNTGRFDEAVACFSRCIVDGSHEPIESTMPRYNIGVIYECTGRVKEAAEQYAACGDFLPALQRLKTLRK